MLYGLEPGLQQRFECHGAYEMFQEKTKLKDTSSIDADLVRDLRIILIAAQNNYVLDASVGDRPVAGADADLWTFGKLDMMTTW